MSCSVETAFVTALTWAVRVRRVLKRCLRGFSHHRILVHLSRGGAEVQIFAPDIPQMHVIDHTQGQPSEKESRCGPGGTRASVLEGQAEGVQPSLGCWPPSGVLPGKC